VKKPGGVSFDLTTGLSDIPVQVNVTKVGEGIDASVFGQDLKIDGPAGAVSALDPADLAPSLRSWVANPQIPGNEDGDDVPWVHLRGEVDVAALTTGAGDLTTQLGAAGAVAPGSTNQAKNALRRGEVNAWKGGRAPYIHRAEVDTTLRGQIDAMPQVTALGLGPSARLSDVNGDVRIAAPEGARTIGPGSITGIPGG